MDEMRYTCDQIEELTPNEIGQFISTRACKGLLNCLEHQDLALKRPPVGSQPLEDAALYQKVRNGMIAYVGRVRGCLNGQSSVHIFHRC